MSEDSSPRLFTIPSGTPFLEALARALLADPTLGGRLGHDNALADITILLPTRRAVRGLNDAFLRMGGGKALLLPRVRPLGDVDEDELVLHADTFAAPEAIGPMDRQLRLARLILDLPDNPAEGDVSRALSLASDLGQFLDMAETEDVDLDGLSDIVPDEFAENWQLTIEFLKLVTTRWPDALSALGLIDQAKRRNLLLNAETESLKAGTQRSPIIAAGSTGSIPATAELLATIAGLPNGAVVLPGLDLMLDEDSFADLPHSHPQYGMKHLLDRMGATRKDVNLWPDCEISKAQEARARFLSEAMRPATTTEKWHGALEGLARDTLEFNSISELFLLEIEVFRVEAETIALMMREVLETPGKTAALVTPDRGLARRVAMDLRRWGIEIDDSAGRPLAQTAPMSFLRHVAEMVASDFAPVELLACLKHPLASLGQKSVSLRSDIRVLERAVLRGPRPAGGLAGLRAALGHSKAGTKDLKKLIDRLEAACTPFAELLGGDKASFGDLLKAHITCAEAIAKGVDKEDTLALWAKEEGAVASKFISELMVSAPALGEIDPYAYGQVFVDLARAGVVRPKFGAHPRLSIWGPLEARLQHADRMILGGLNEGAWPADAKLDPWLNRPMRKSLGLEPPERRIGLSAHDFVEGASASEVYLTRALKVDGAPTVASRWVLRLQGLVKGMGLEHALDAPKWMEWAQSLDAASDVSPIDKPAPRPPLDKRPTKFSVTEIETLIRDPYSIYAKHVLRLKPLDAIDESIAAAERGTIIHEALELFVRAYPETLPENAYEELIRLGREAFAETIDRPNVATFWWPRFERIAEWIVEFETKHREAVTKAHEEKSGLIEIGGLKRPTTLRGRADRIDEMTDGTLTIIDYKTGGMPGKREVEVGLAPQLPLEAAMAARGGFGKDLTKETSNLMFLRLTGGAKAGETRAIPTIGLVENIWDDLVRLLKQYEDEATPYLSHPRPQFIGRFAEYDHLARVKEWSTSGEGGE
ncbi:MAG: double-strand break repair protein AddB [Parvibaculum sp.]|nr:double-strand break repair protein AddB [Parvibaculum sp.]